MRKQVILLLVLIVFCALPILSIPIICIRGQQDISVTENRFLKRFPEFSLPSFISGKFQADLEEALGDQFITGERIKRIVLNAQNSIFTSEKKLIETIFPDTVRSYTEISSGFYHYSGDEHRIVEKPWVYAITPENLERAAIGFNSAENVRKYVFFIRNSRAQDFTLPEKDNNLAFNLIRSAYHADDWAQFSAVDYDEFCSLFYQTDHHWNYFGADRGYRQILSMLLPEESPLSPEEEWDFEVVFNGSYARLTGLLCADESFRAYSYSIPKLKTMLNGKNGQYGHRSVYEKNRVPDDELRNHYAYYYGGDYGEIRIDNGHSRGRNLLVIADSYSNPINLLLASHYDQTYIIDTRYYEKDISIPFEVNQYITDYDVDTMLMLGDIALFADTQEKGADD